MKQIDFFTLLIAMGFTMYKGYYAACARPTDDKALYWYRIYQAVIIVFWVIFSITSAGCFDGWDHISDLISGHNGAARFCIALLILEACGFLYGAIMGIICFFTISNVFFLLKKI